MARAAGLRGGGNGEDWILLALAEARRGHLERARRWYDRDVAGMAKRSGTNFEDLRFRGEAAKLLGIKAVK